MKKAVQTSIVCLLSAICSLACIQTALAYEQVTAYEAYSMYMHGAVLIDVRTPEEMYWVGGPAAEPGGDPISFLIPWTSIEVEDTGEVIKQDNSDFINIVQTHFKKRTPLILFCRSGGRSSAAAQALEESGFYNVYEIDNYLDDGGRGGFQGTGYSNSYQGYRGYPRRLPVTGYPDTVKVKYFSQQITNPDDSVSWMDSKLPVTQKIDPSKILTLGPDPE